MIIDQYGIEIRNTTTPEHIERNEMSVSIGIIPTRCIEITFDDMKYLLPRYRSIDDDDWEVG